MLHKIYDRFRLSMNLYSNETVLFSSKSNGFIFISCSDSDIEDDNEDVNEMEFREEGIYIHKQD